MRSATSGRAPASSTARPAGVAIGTVFRHFPTKKDLLLAIVKELLERLTDEAHELIEQGDPATALFAFFRHVVGQASATRGVTDLLAQAGVDIEVAGAVSTFRQAVGTLLDRAQRVHEVRDDIELDEVMALLAATTQGALRAGWESALQDRVLGVVFDGLRPVERR